MSVTSVDDLEDVLSAKYVSYVVWWIPGYRMDTH